ncbi:CHAD domain-containing protein [Streptomyces sp. NBC_01190]|uniref:CYTH and CHAD domain-containing protein n=1 Tax=Streptomyces sp. NBC_01190 TaxID=2903767 RepID=UPI003867F211|nr:CYTH and CHAD domain-containing protein [Streptomyces sp. NBC_01190]
MLDPDRLRRLPGVSRVREERPEDLDAVYYDTADLRLLAHGITLRRRRGGADEGWHVKLPRESPPDDGASGGDGVREDPREVHAPLRAGKAGAVPGELNRYLKAYSRGGGLIPVAHLRTHRRRLLLLDEQDHRLVELAEDRVAAQVLGAERLSPGGPGRAAGRAGGAKRGGGAGTKPAGRGKPAAAPPPADGNSTEITQWSEIRVERDQGDRVLLAATARQLEADGWHAAPDAHQLDHALAGRSMPRAGATGPDRRPAPGSAGEAVLNRFAEQLGLLLTYDAAARADQPDAVHEMRSTSRRLRSLLRGSKRVLDRERTDTVAGELRWLTGALGGSRDSEVLAARLRKQARDLGGPEGKELARRIAAQEEERHRTAHRATLKALDSPRYHRLLDSLERLRATPPLLPGRADQPAAKHLRKVAARDQRRLAARMAAAEQAGCHPHGQDRDRALHEARKAARRARHTAETALPYGGKKAARLRKRTKAVQQVLGDHQDAVMARAALPELAAAARAVGDDTYGYGRLHGRQDELAREARHRLPAVWEKVADPGLVRF